MNRPGEPLYLDFELNYRRKSCPTSNSNVPPIPFCEKESDPYWICTTVVPSDVSLKMFREQQEENLVDSSGEEKNNLSIPFFDSCVFASSYLEQSIDLNHHINDVQYNFSNPTSGPFPENNRPAIPIYTHLASPSSLCNDESNKSLKETIFSKNLEFTIYLLRQSQLFEPILVPTTIGNLSYSPFDSLFSTAFSVVEKKPSMTAFKDPRISAPGPLSMPLVVDTFCSKHLLDVDYDTRSICREMVLSRLEIELRKRMYLLQEIQRQEHEIFQMPLELTCYRPITEILESSTGETETKQGNDPELSTMEGNTHFMVSTNSSKIISSPLLAASIMKSESVPSDSHIETQILEKTEEKFNNDHEEESKLIKDAIYREVAQKLHILVNSNYFFYQYTIPPLIKGLLKAGIKKENIHVIIGSSPESRTIYYEEMKSWEVIEKQDLKSQQEGKFNTKNINSNKISNKSGIALHYRDYDYIDFTALWWAANESTLFVNSQQASTSEGINKSVPIPSDMDVNEKAAWFFYVHDTVTVGPSFHDSLIERITSTILLNKKYKCFFIQDSDISESSSSCNIDYFPSIPLFSMEKQLSMNFGLYNQAYLATEGKRKIEVDVIEKFEMFKGGKCWNCEMNSYENCSGNEQLQSEDPSRALVDMKGREMEEEIQHLPTGKRILFKQLGYRLEDVLHYNVSCYIKSSKEILTEAFINKNLFLVKKRLYSSTVVYPYASNTTFTSINTRRSEVIQEQEGRLAMVIPEIDLIKYLHHRHNRISI